MKFMKRLTALLLCAACVCTLVTAPPASAADTVSTFPDITDPQVGRAVEALRTMGVIDGGGDGNYDPDGSLTRAAFCKMAILVMGKGDEAQAQANRTIFNDVPASHWARGYVNLAALTTVGGGGEEEENQDAPRLMMGLGNGSFAPDRVISYGEAVTILLRMLGYSKEAGINWPGGAVDTAAGLGLTEGFTPPRASAAVTRAQAALLFCNMLTAPLAGSKEPYANKYFGELKKDLVLVSCNEKTENGQGAVRFFSKENARQDPVPYTVHAPASFLQGCRGTAIVKDEKLVTFLPDSGAGSKLVTISSASAGSTCVITATDGTKITLAPDTKVWNSESEKPDEYRDTFKRLDRPGMTVTVCYTAAGAVDYLYVDSFIADSAKNGVMVAKNPVSGNPFAQLTAGATDYSVVKNGIPASISEIRRYDVATYDADAKVLYVSDFRLNCTYLSASPNTAAPSKIQISVDFGDSLKDGLPVLNCAIDDLKQFKFGENFTLLFSADGKVAGAVKSSEARSNAVGYVKDGKLLLVNAPENLSTVSIPTDSSVKLDSYRDCLVTVSGTKTGVSLSRLNGRTPSGPLDVDKRTLAGVSLAENVVVFDRIVNSGIRQVSLSAVSMDSVPASKVAYQRTNAAGEVDLLVLDNVTGDLYTYGKASVESKETGDGWTVPKLDENGNKIHMKDKDGNYLYEQDEDGNDILDKPIYETTTVKTSNTVTTVTNAKKTLLVVGGTSYKDGQFIGLASSVEKLKGTEYNRHAASVALKSVEKVSPANFNMNTLLFFSGSIQLPISDDVQCYNAQTKTWFGASSTQGSASGETASGETSSSGTSPMDNLRACLSYSSNLTVYYDRDPGQGGKVRVVVAN